MAIGNFDIPEAISNIIFGINSKLPINFPDGAITSIETFSGIQFVKNPTALNDNITDGNYDSYIEFDNNEFVCILPTKTTQELYYSYKRDKFTSMFDGNVEDSVGNIRLSIPRTFYNHRPSLSSSAYLSCATIVTKSGVFTDCVPVISLKINAGADYYVTVTAIPFLFNIGNCASGYNETPSLSPRAFGNTLISDIQYFRPSFTYYRGDNGTRYVGYFTVNDIVSSIKDGLLNNTFQNGTTLPVSVDLNAFYSLFKNIVFVSNEDEYNSAILESYVSLIERAEHFDGSPAPPYTPPGGGDGGYGNPSSPSNTITGSFDGTPGPSIVGNLPVGSSGADIASSGMYTKYLCNNALLNTLAQFFWEDNLGIQALKAVFGNPIDSIISLACYPFALDTLVPNTSTTIYFGKYNTTWPAFSLTKSSFQIDWGTVNIPFFWGSFLDYAPYTKIQLYLPWGVGFVSLDPNEVMPWSSKNSFNQTDFATGSVRVVTNIELDKGSCVHNVVGNNGRIIGSFGGIVGKQIPVVGTDDSARTLALIGSAMMIGTSVAGAAASFGGTTAGAVTAGGFLGATSAIASGAVESIPTSTLLASTSALAKTSPTYPRAGTFSDATNTLGYQYPYLIISRPSQSVPQQYGRFMGYPSNIFHNHLGEVRGYTEVSSIHLDDIPATSNELDELESILKGGVLL